MLHVLKGIVRSIERTDCDEAVLWEFALETANHVGQDAIRVTLEAKRSDDVDLLPGDSVEIEAEVRGFFSGLAKLMARDPAEPRPIVKLHPEAYSLKNVTRRGSVWRKYPAVQHGGGEQ